MDEGCSGCGCLIILLIGAAAFVFWPRYDLEIASLPGPNGYEVVEEGFWTKGACRKAAAKYRKYDSWALEWNYWGRWVGYEYSKWGEKHRL